MTREIGGLRTIVRCVSGWGCVCLGCVGEEGEGAHRISRVARGQLQKSSMLEARWASNTAVWRETLCGTQQCRSPSLVTSLTESMTLLGSVTVDTSVQEPKAGVLRAT